MYVNTLFDVNDKIRIIMNDSRLSSKDEITNMTWIHRSTFQQLKHQKGEIQI